MKKHDTGPAVAYRLELRAEYAHMHGLVGNNEGALKDGALAGGDEVADPAADLPPNVFVLVRLLIADAQVRHARDHLEAPYAHEGHTPPTSEEGDC